jgi:predicted nuclease of predicted toxin-antitoxin system
VRVLLDENLPHDLAGLFVGHDTDTVAGLGWAGIQNGELLQRAATAYDAFLTMDRRLPDQQRVDRLPFAIILILAPTNRMTHLRPLVPDILRALESARPGAVTAVGQ